MRRVHHVYLIPGFFGFANLGKITYFGHVRRILATLLAARRVDARIEVVRTYPTASLPVRAAKLAAVVSATAGRGRGPIHLIGHSSGGLDARLFAEPDVVLPTRGKIAFPTARLGSVVTVATPHHGTPLARSFATLQGQRMLQLLSLGSIYMLRFGGIPLTGLLKMGGVVARLDDLVANSEFLDEVYRRLLADFSPARRRAVARLLDEVVRDQALMLQLTPEAMEVFDASVRRRTGVRYGSVVAQAAPPSLRSRIDAGLDPTAQVTRALYATLYGMAAATPRRQAPRLAAATTRALRRSYGVMPSVAANDGIVPTRSQVWGPVIHAAKADHLDVLGHFRDASTDPPHVDWLVTGSGFDLAGFEALWSDVADFLVA